MRTKKHAGFARPSASAPEDTKTAALQYGVAYRSPGSDPLQYPAIKDFETVQMHINSRIEVAEVQIERLKESIWE